MFSFSENCFSFNCQFYFGLSKHERGRLHLTQDSVVTVLTSTRKHYYITPRSFHLIPIQQRIHLQILLIGFWDTPWLSFPVYCISADYTLIRPLRSSDRGFLVVLRISGAGKGTFIAVEMPSGMLCLHELQSIKTVPTLKLNWKPSCFLTHMNNVSVYKYMLFFLIFMVVPLCQRNPGPVGRILWNVTHLWNVAVCTTVPNLVASSALKSYDSWSASGHIFNFFFVWVHPSKVSGNNEEWEQLCQCWISIHTNNNNNNKVLRA